MAPSKCKLAPNVGPTALSTAAGLGRLPRDLYQPDLSEPVGNLIGRVWLCMNMLYDLVPKSSDEAVAFFYWRIYWSHPGLYRWTGNHTTSMTSANAQTDIVPGTWNSPYLEPHLWPQFGEDTLDVGLSTRTSISDGDVDIDVVYALRKHREVRSWEVRVQNVREYAHTGRGWIPSSGRGGWRSAMLIRRIEKGMSSSDQEVESKHTV